MTTHARTDSIARLNIHTFSIAGWDVLFDPVTLDLAAKRDADVLVLSQPGLPRSRMRVRLPSATGRIRQVTLEMTPACHLKCRYCYIDDRATPRGSARLNIGTAETFLKHVAGEGPLPAISFFGGEPFLAWRRIQKIVAFAEAYQAQRGFSQPAFHVTTSGTLMTPSRAEFLATHNFSVIVSLDGPRRLHDINRRTRHGKPTFDRVMSGIRMLADAGLSNHLTLRGTFDGQPDGGAFHLVERAEYLNRLCDDGLAAHASVEPAFVSETVCSGSSAAPIKTDILPILRREYDALGDWFISRLASGKAARFHQIAVPLKRLSNKQPADSECGAGKGYVSLAADGAIHACHRQGPPAMTLGHAETGINPERQAPWLDNTTTHRTDCRTCPIRRVCGGGCRADSIAAHNDIMKSVQAFCDIRQLCFEQAVKILIARARSDASPHDD